MSTKTSDDYVREGVMALGQHDLKKAKFLLVKAIDKDKRNVDAFYNLGAVELYLGNQKLAIEAYESALNLAPSDYEVWYNLGTVYIGQQDYQKAIDCFERSLKINPYYQNALNNLGVSYNYVGRLEESMTVLKKSLELNQENPSVFNNIGVSYSKSGLPAEAIGYFQRAINLNPDYASALNNLGNALQQLGQFDEAEKYYQRAIELDKNYTEALINLASNYNEKREPKKTIKYYLRARKLAPKNAQIAYHTLYILMQVCDWEEVKKITTNLKSLVGLEDPLMNIMHSDDVADNYCVAKAWSDEIESRTKKIRLYKLKPRKRIRVGYVNNFQEKPVAMLTKDIFKLHDKKKFETFAFSFGAAPGAELREKVASEANHFIDTADISNIDVARLIRNERIDILVDLKGYTKGHRTEIFAYKPAPIQISYMGFPGTTGASFFDYVITDKTVTPKAVQKYYSEKHIYMPDCYLMVSDPEVVPIKVSRKSCGLPDGKFVYINLGQTLKIEEKMFKLWLRILKKTDSVLWLHRSNKLAEKNLKLYALEHGVDPDRLIFAPSVRFQDHINRMSQADLALDTSIYNGGATNAYMLYANVPVITITGKHYLSRMGTSLLSSLKMNELITKDYGEYEKLAVTLANDANKMQALKEKLRKNAQQTNLFKPEIFVKNLEEHYIKMVNEKVRDLK